jgi:hypothetical protein
MLTARTLSIPIQKNAPDLYEQIWRPSFFPRWAAGLSDAELRQDGDHWIAGGPEGPIRIRFTPHNAFGIMDHFVDTGQGDEIHVPLRVVANGDGSEVILTLFQQPGMDDDRFSADIKLVNRDLKTLKKLIEG